MSSIAAALLRRPISAWMILVALLLLGSTAAARMPAALLPAVASPGLTIITRYYGAPAETMERIITIPVERQLSDIADIQTVSSVSQEGESRVSLIFSEHSDIRLKMLEAGERMQLLREQLPGDVEDPAVVRYDPGDRPIFIVVFESSTLSVDQTREIVDRIWKPRFERIEGVSEVFVSGGREREVAALVDPGRLSALRWPAQRIFHSISGNDLYAGPGRLAGDRDIAVTLDARSAAVQNLEAALLPSGDAAVAIGQALRIAEAGRDADSLSTVDGAERVALYVQKAGSASGLTVSRACRAAVVAAGSAPPSRIAFDQGDSIESALRQAVQSTVLGAVFACLTVLFFLRRPQLSAVVIVSLPGSAAGAFALMSWSGVELNVMSLAGLALGGGMLLDNSIVLADAIEKRLGEAMTPLSAAFDSVRACAAELIASTLTTIAVFLPLLFTSAETRDLYRDLALTVCYTLLVSLLLSLSVAPAIAVSLLERRRGKRADPAPARFSGPLSIGVRNILARGLQRWQQLIELSLQRPRLCGIILLAVLLFAPALLWLLPARANSPLDGRQLHASLDLPTGASLERTQTIAAEVQQQLRSHPLVSRVTARIEKSHAELHLDLADDVEPQQAIAALRELTDRRQDAFVYYDAAGEARGAELNVELYGEDFKSLRSAAQDLAAALPSQVNGIDQTLFHFRETRVEIQLLPRRDRMAALGISSVELGGALRQLLAGIVIHKHFDGQRLLDVRYRARPDLLRGPADLQQMVLPVGEHSLALRSLLEFREGEGEPRIWRKNKRRMLSFGLRLLTGDLEQAADQLNDFLRARVPSGISFQLSDDYLRQRAARRQMLLAVAVALLLIYMLLAALLESLLRPLIVFLTAPLSTSAALLGLWISNSGLGVTALIGLVMLGGIVVNSSILILSAIEDRLLLHPPKDAAALRGALVEATLARMRPIAMTTLTTLAGMLPAALDNSAEADLWRPLAIAVASGALASMAAASIATPWAAWFYYSRQLAVTENHSEHNKYEELVQ